jgi:hypothetical protein
MLSENTLEGAGRGVAAPRTRRKKGLAFGTTERFLCEEGGRDESPPERGDEKKKSSREDNKNSPTRPAERAEGPDAFRRRAKSGRVRVVSFVPSRHGKKRPRPIHCEKRYREVNRTKNRASARSLVGPTTKHL